MKNYPEIVLQWKEVGLSFQVQFVKKNYEENEEEYITNVGGDVGDNVGDDINDNNGSQSFLSAILILMNIYSGFRKPVFIDVSG